MMLSFLLFLSLFSCYLSRPDNKCGWAIIEDGLQPLNFCHKKRDIDGSMTSCIIQCDQNNNAIQVNWWSNSEECDKNIKPSFITHPPSSNFNCNDTLCISSYVTYKTYLINECESSGNIITDNNIISDASNNNNNNNDNTPFAETSLITETCYNSTNSPYYERITCNNHSYSIHSYLDASCNQLISSNIINNSYCKEILFCSNPTDIDSTTTTTSYFTTTTTPETSCNFINLNGNNIPTDKCITLSAIESQKFECNADGTAIEFSYYHASLNCIGNATYSWQYPLDLIIDWNCNANTCDDDEFMELIIYKDEQCGIDAISDTDYDSHLFVLNTCMITADGEGVIYECINNNNNDGLSAGYTITKYLDNNCLIPSDDDPIFYNEIECIADSQRRQHMVFCNGPNIITIKEEHSYIIDCNYFINDHVDPLGLVGEPLNACMSIQHGQFIYSKIYQCNKDRTGIEESVYDGEHCLSENFKFKVDRPEFTEFYCESDYSCNAINYTKTNAFGESVSVFNYDSVLIGKQYTNDTCFEPIEEFWYYQHIIIDECCFVGDGLYSVMSCDENGFVYHSLYNDPHCTPQSLAFNQRFDKFDCIFGKLFETVYCPHWKQDSPIIITTTTTQEPIITTKQPANNESIIIYNTTSYIPPDTTKSVYTTIGSEDTVVTKNTVDTTKTITSISSTDSDDSVDSDDSYDMSTTQEGGGIKGADKEEGEEPCINMFGGRDVGGASCKVWEDVIWALIVLVSGIIACFVFWCWCSHETKPFRREHSLSSNSSKQKKNKKSQLNIPNGNDNEDLQHIVVQQLNKGQHVNANKNINRGQVPPAIQEVQDDDSKYDDDHDFDI